MQNDHLLLNPLVDSGRWSKVSGAAARFMGVLLRHGDANWRCFLRNDTAARECGVCVGHFYRARRELEKAGVLSWSTDGRKTFYQLHTPSMEKRGTSTKALNAAPTEAQIRYQTVRRRSSTRGPSIAVLTSSSNSSVANATPSPALPAAAAALMDRMKKSRIRPAKIALFASSWPEPVLAWALGRLEKTAKSKRGVDNPTGFLALLLEQEGAERAAMAAMEAEEQARIQELRRDEERRKAEQRNAEQQVQGMVRSAWARLTPAQQIGLHLRAAELADLPMSVRNKLKKWNPPAEPSPIALAVLQADLGRSDTSPRL